MILKSIFDHKYLNSIIDNNIKNILTMKKLFIFLFLVVLSGFIAVQITEEQEYQKQIDDLHKVM